MHEPTLADLQAAAALIGPHIQRTPVITSRLFDEASGGVHTHFKCENLQHGGSFKLRGALNFLLSMPETDVGRGVVAFSSGNHAQATAIAAGIRGTKATLLMPDDSSRSKVEATQNYGGTVICFDRFKEDRIAIANRLCEETGATFVPPFDHPWIIAGQGTAALELLEEAGQVDALVVCTGGGGLLSGSAIAARTLNPGLRVFAVEPELANDWALSMEAGQPVEIAPPSTIADGLRTPKPGKLTFQIAQRLVERVILVSEQEIIETMKFLLLRMKMLVEPSGAVAAAAVLFGKLPAEIRSVGVILSGGNVDWELLRSL